MSKQPRDLAQLLIRKAEADLRSASLLLGDDDLVDPACFHIQQASEKLLKALLASAGIAYPFTHDLGELLSLALTRFPALAEFSATLPFYTDFAVATRYLESILPSRQDAVDALATAERLKRLVLAEVR